jgi:hypothetical protein
VPESLLPPHTREHLYRGSWTLPGADDFSCEGAKYHSPRPLFVQSTALVRQQWWEGPEGERPEHAYWAWAPTAWLCGTCRDNLDILLQMLHTGNGDLDWAIRREFGNEIRALAVKGWKWFDEHRPAGVATSPTKG